MTGTGLARDLSLRGVSCLLVEKRDLVSGASGGNHGLLHSGARYVGSDPQAAAECRKEAAVLRTIAPHAIDDCGGLFVAVPGDDESYLAEFPGLCAASGVSVREVDPQQAREQEPALADTILAAFAVNDASVDPFMLCVDNVAQAVGLGSQVRRNTRVEDFVLEGGRIVLVRCRDETRGQLLEVEAEVVVNAAGAWAGNIAGLAGADLPMLYSKGTMIVTQDRITRRVINRLRPATDADILVPGGTVSILGTTSVRIEDPDRYAPTVEEVDAMIEDAVAMVPVLQATRYIRAYAGVRPLISPRKGVDARKVSRGYTLHDHEEDGIGNLVTITGGKLTTFRLMAEKTADMVCGKLGVAVPCTTMTEPLPPSGASRWSEPGRSVRAWVDKSHARGTMLCECEMVSSGVVDDILAELDGMRGRSALKAISQRSRVGKGPCQGGFCGPRITGHLYETGVVRGWQGVRELKRFISRRWRGKVPVLWGITLMQAELQEALHCGAMELDLVEESLDQESSKLEAGSLKEEEGSSKFEVGSSKGEGE